MGNVKFPSKILIIDHDIATTNLLESMLQSRQIPVVKATSYDKALYLFSQHKIDLCMIEKEIDEIPATVLIQKFRTHEIPSKRNPAIIVMSTSKTDQEDGNYKELGAVAIIVKPIKEPSLIGMIARSMEEALAKNALHELKVNVFDPLINSGNFEKAVNLAEDKLLSSGPKARFLGSQVYENTEHLSKAVKVTSELHETDPSNLQYINQLGRINLKLGDFDKANKYFESADKLAPDNLERLENMANTYLNLNLPDHSIAKYRKLIHHNPEKPDLKYKFFETLQAHGFANQARAFCDETTTAIELIRHFNNKGVAFSKQQKYRDAIDEYQKACNLIPKSKELYRIFYNMAIAHINLKQLDDLKMAKQLLNRSLEIKPDYLKATEKLAMLDKHLSKSA